VRRGPWRTLVALPLGVLAALAAGWNVAGPPPARTGGFGEASCHECHFDGPLNPEPGAVAIDGAPTSYEPGHIYPLRITVRDPLLKRAGFQLAARFAAGPGAGRQAGDLQIAEGVGTTTVADGVTYAHHVARGTVPELPGEHGWTVEWTAPADAAGGDVVLHVAANAANDDDSEFGDQIYTASITILAPALTPARMSAPRRPTGP
jgi:hypothetical protein